MLTSSFVKSPCPHEDGMYVKVHHWANHYCTIWDSTSDPSNAKVCNSYGSEEIYTDVSYLGYSFCKITVLTDEVMESHLWTYPNMGWFVYTNHNKEMIGPMILMGKIYPLPPTMINFLQKIQISEITMAPRGVLTSPNLFRMMNEEENLVSALFNNDRCVYSLSIVKALVWEFVGN